MLIIDTVGGINFPELEIVGCPARYDHQSQAYIVNFQWRVPFSPAALSHIQLISIRADRLLKLDDEFNDFTLLQPGVFSDTVTVNVSYCQYRCQLLS